MAEKKANQEQTLGHAPTAASQVVYSPETIRDTRTLAGEYLVQQPESLKRYQKQKVNLDIVCESLEMWVQYQQSEGGLKGMK